MHQTLSTIQMIEALIKTPSVSSVLPDRDMGNITIIQLLANWLNDFGFNVEIMPLDSAGHKANLIATKGQGDNGLVLSGHTDTVPFDEHLWQHNPLGLTRKDNKLIGLGSCDMKSFLAMAISAANSFDDQDFKQPLIILATADEESSMQGAKALANAGTPKACAAIIGEPTSLQPIRMHKGIMMERISLLGQSGHSSNPALGHSALEAMQLVLAELTAFRHELQERYQNSMFEVPHPTLNFGHIHGGDNPNRICGDCLLDIDIRILPGMQITELRALLHKRLSALLTDTAIEIKFTSLFDGIPAMETQQDAEIVQQLEKITKSASGAVTFATEAPYLQSLGMDAVVMGPGDIAVAHQPDEYLYEDTIQPTIDLLKKVIQKYCIDIQ